MHRAQDLLWLESKGDHPHVLAAHRASIVEHDEDMPEIVGWRFQPR